MHTHMSVPAHPVNFQSHCRADRQNRFIIRYDMDYFTGTLAFNRVQNLNGRASGEFNNSAIAWLAAAGGVKHGTIKLYSAGSRTRYASFASP